MVLVELGVGLDGLGLLDVVLERELALVPVQSEEVVAHAFNGLEDRCFAGLTGLATGLLDDFLGHGRPPVAATSARNPDCQRTRSILENIVPVDMPKRSIFKAWCAIPL